MNVPFSRGRCAASLRERRARVFRVDATAVGLLWLAGILLTANGVLAQQSGNGATDAGRIERRIERPPDRREKVPDIAPAVPDRGPSVQVQPERFTLIGAEITGSTVYSAARLGDFYEAYLGREISVAEVDAIVKAITEQYRSDGYVLSRAVAPPQPLEFGVLRIRIVEGYVDRVAFAGDRPGRQALLDEMADRIRAERPLTLATMERYLLLMADSPGVTVEPGLVEIEPDTGAYRLEIALAHDRIDGFATFDNRGTTTVGPHQTYFGANANSAFGLLERTRVAAFTVPGAPEELRYGEINHEQVLDAEGTRAYFTLSRSIVDIGRAGTSSKENSHGTRVVVGMSHPVLRRRESNLTLRLNFDALDSDKNSPNDVYDDRLRVLRLGVEFNARDGWGGTNWISAQLSRGFDILHASDSDSTLLSRTNGRARFHKLTLDATRLQTIGDGWAVQASAVGQASPHTLLSSEEFGVGGSRFGRAYDPSDISGSQGAAGFLELQYDPPLKVPLLESYQFYAFYDGGAVWGSGFTRASMVSAGGGVRFQTTYDVSGGVEVAKPLTRSATPGEENGDDARIFFNLYARF
jgi:hemolysin activation/secretion protein